MTSSPNTSGVLAIALFLCGRLTEARLARKLGVDTQTARAQAGEFLDLALQNLPAERLLRLEAQLAAANTRLAGRDNYLHDLRNQAQVHLLLAEELREALAAADRRIAELTDVVRYAWLVAGAIPVSAHVDGVQLSSKELFLRADQALERRNP